MAAEFVPSDPTFGPAPTLPHLMTPSVPSNGEIVAIIITTLALLGIAAYIIAFLWMKRRRIVAAVDDAVIEAAAKTVKGSRRLWRRIEDRAAQ
jgi:hypothetical protein